jgi:dephospho-CoA kinase
MLARMRGDAEPIQTEVITPPQRPRIIGLTGPAGCGKTFVASMVPDAVVIGLADPIYAALASILGIPETVLRQRATKERPIEWLGKSPRQLLQTLGTDWGRTLVAEDLWLRIARRRIEELAATGAGAVVIADVRFDNEAALVQEMGGEVWLVDRRPATEAAPHVSEAGLSPGLIDRVVDNTGTPEQTRANVAAILASE